MADSLSEQVQILRDRVAAVRADATGLRARMGDEFQARGTDLGISLDQARSARQVADHRVEDADVRAAQLEAIKTGYQKDLASTQAALDAATAANDSAKVDDLGEHADGFRRMIGEGEARLHAAKLDAAAAREEAGSATRGAMEAELAYDEHYVAVGAAEGQIDKIEQQADLIEQARLKLFEAEVMYGDQPPADADAGQWVTERADLEGEAAALLRRADAIVVDRAVIAVLVPEADDPAAPNDDLMDPNDDDSSTQLPTTDKVPSVDDSEDDDDRDDGVDDGQPVLIAAGDVDSLGLDLTEAGEAAETEPVADVATPTAALDDAGAQFEIAGPDQTQEVVWGAGDDAATDEWNAGVDQDTEDISAVDDDSFDSDGF